MIQKKEIVFNNDHFSEKSNKTSKLVSECYENMKEHLKIDLTEKKIYDPESDEVFKLLNPNMNKTMK